MVSIELFNRDGIMKRKKTSSLQFTECPYGEVRLSGLLLTVGSAAVASGYSVDIC